MVASDPVEEANGGATLKSPSQNIDIKNRNQINAFSSPHFPGLSVCFLDSAGNEPVKCFPPNSALPITFETDLFEGVALILLRPPISSQDVLYHERIFASKKRNIEIQIQGKFKEKPRHVVYIGLEISERMKVGLVSKGMCNMILNFIQRIIQIHYSFGDKDNDELPHIVFPLEKADRLIITEPGDSPPPLGFSIEESAESVANRKSGKSPTPDWNVHDTYTVSYNSMYIDLPAWEVCNLPIMRNVDLRTFWGDSNLRMVAYEVDVDKFNGKHTRENIKYVFCAQVAFSRGDDRSTNDESDEILSDVGRQATSLLPWDKARLSVTRTITERSKLVRVESTLNLKQNLPIEEASSDSEGYKSEGEPDDTSVYFDAVESMPSSTSIDSYCSLGLGDVDDKSTLDAIHSSRLRVEQRLSVDHLCPGWIDMCDSMGRYVRVFAFALSKSRTFFRSSPDIFKCMPQSYNAKQREGSPRLSRTERLRRKIGSYCARMMHSARPDEVDEMILSFQSKGSDKYDKTFLRHHSRTSIPLSTQSKSPVLSPSMEGFVARAVSERHWIEQWATVSTTHVSFYHPDRKTPSYRIRVDSISNVRRLVVQEEPHFPSFSFFAVETLGRTVYIMVPTEVQRDRWVAYLSKRLRHQDDSDEHHGCNPMVGCMISISAPDNPTQEYLHKSSLWSCKNRRVMNCRKFAFGGEIIKNPCLLSQQVLEQALQLTEDSEVGNMCTFLDNASDLKRVDVSKLGEKERMVFLVNLYHIMVTHAFLVLGTPSTGFQWISYFNMISYQCSDDIFSLAELEHSILRVGMNPPSQFASKFILPKSQYAFAMKIRDFRINFALNCGSLSNPPTVPVYTVEDFEQQLEESARNYLKESVDVVSSRKSTIVTLPRICQWYAHDFGSGQPEDTVMQLTPFFPKDVRDTILKLSGESKFSVKFSRYDYRCRFLTLSK